MSVKETANHFIQGFDKKARAFIQIQTGCDHRCTFCIIPFGRGNNRSFDPFYLIDEVERVVENGVKEIVFIISKKKEIIKKLFLLEIEY